MNNYCDEYGRLHHKPVTEANPIPSNNSWIYTAYAHKLGLTLFWEGLKRCYELCRVYYETKGDYILNRSPEKTSVPISRDEILGMVFLGFLKPSHLNGWNFSPFPLPAFSLTKLLSQLWELRPTIKCAYDGKYVSDRELVFKHRNYFWQNNLDQLYRFAFSVPLTDRYFMLKTWDTFRWYKPSHLCYYVIAKVDSLLGKKNGIRFLKYALIGAPDAKSKGLLTAMAQEFPADHPISEAVERGFAP